MKAYPTIAFGTGLIHSIPNGQGSLEVQPGKHSPFPQINPGGHESGLEMHFLVVVAGFWVEGCRVSISVVDFIVVSYIVVRIIEVGIIVGGLIVVKGVIVVGIIVEEMVVDSCSQYLKRQ